MLANTGSARLNVHPTAILLATSKVLGRTNPFSSSWKAKVHKQRAGKAAK